MDKTKQKPTPPCDTCAHVEKVGTAGLWERCDCLKRDLSDHEPTCWAYKKKEVGPPPPSPAPEVARASFF